MRLDLDSKPDKARKARHRVEVASRRRPVVRRLVLENLESRELLASVTLVNTVGPPDEPGIREIVIGDDGSFQVFRREFTQGQIFSPSTAPADAGIFIRTPDGVVGGFDTTRGAAGATQARPYRPISIELSPDGTQATAIFDNNTAQFPATNRYQVTQVSSYRPGDEFFRVQNTIRNQGTTPLEIDVFAAADIFLAGDDRGFGFLNEEFTAVGGTNFERDYNIFFQPIPTNEAPSASAFQAAGFNTIWQVIGGTIQGGDFNNTVNTEFIDNGAGLQWQSIQIAPNAMAQIDYFVAFGASTGISNFPLEGQGVELNQTEGQPFNSVVGRFVDTDPIPGAPFNFTASIDWGDGTRSTGTIIPDPEDPSAFFVLGEHTYQPFGTYSIQVEVRRIFGLSTTFESTAIVGDAPIIGQGRTLFLFQEVPFTGVVATFTDTNPFGRATEFTATIDSGDGVIVPATIREAGPSQFEVVGSIQFDQTGTFPLTITISSVGGQEATVISTVEVIEGELVGLRFAAENFNVVAGEPFLFVPVERLISQAGEVRVRVRTVDGTAIAGVHYVPQDIEIVFTDGDDAPKFVQIPILAAATENLFFRVILSDPTGGAFLLSPSTTTVTITPTPPPPPVQQTVMFSQVNYVVAEDAGAAFITVVRSSAEGSFTFRFTAGPGGTAAPGVRYTPINQEFTFAPGELTKVIEIPIINTTQADGNQTVDLALSVAQGAGMVGSPGTATLTILDVTPPEVVGTFAFSSPIFTVNEGEGVARITIVRTNGSAGRVVIGFTTALGSARPGIDYTPVTQAVVFEDGETSKVIEIPIFADPQQIGLRTVGLFLTTPSAGFLGPISTAELFIEDAPLPPDVDPLVVTDVRLVGAGRAPSGILLNFSTGLNPLVAQFVGNYVLLAPGPDGRIGTADDQQIPIAAAVYDPTFSTVLLIPAVSLRAGVTYQLHVNAQTPEGIADLSGRRLDGNFSGTPGGNFSILFSRATTHTYVDSNGDTVRLQLQRGGTLDLIRNPAGDAQVVRLVNPVPGRSILQGGVRRGPGGDGRTTIGRIVGLDPFGRIRSRVTTPPFFVGQIVPEAVDILLAQDDSLNGRPRQRPRV